MRVSTPSLLPDTTSAIFEFSEFLLGKSQGQELKWKSVLSGRRDNWEGSGDVALSLASSES